jgi:hypothetical protein
MGQEQARGAKGNVKRRSVAGGGECASPDDVPGDGRAIGDGALATIEPAGGSSPAEADAEASAAIPRVAFTSAAPIGPGRPTSPATLRALVFVPAAVRRLLGLCFCFAWTPTR